MFLHCLEYDHPLLHWHHLPLYVGIVSGEVYDECIYEKEIGRVYRWVAAEVPLGGYEISNYELGTSRTICAHGALLEFQNSWAYCNRERKTGKIQKKFAALHVPPPLPPLSMSNLGTSQRLGA